MKIRLKLEVANTITKVTGQVNEVFDFYPNGYFKWACFGCFCEPFAAYQLAKKLKMNAPLYAVIGFLCWMGVLLNRFHLMFGPDVEAILFQVGE